MNTQELRENLTSLDQRAQSLGQEIISLKSQITNYYNQAAQYQQMANSVMSRAYLAEEDEDYNAIVSQASAYADRALEYETMASRLESQLQEVQGQLRKVKSDYEYYMSEGETNIANLQLAIDKMTGVQETKYGGNEIKGTLNAIKQRLVFNNNLVEGCRKRIAWIEQICGEPGDQYGKVYTYR